MYRLRLIVLTSIAGALLLVPVADADDDAANGRTSDMAWMAGDWAGTGDDGTTTGDAYSVWTEPVEGVMSWTFRWHQPDKDHVHFAFSVIEETAVGVLLRGVHHG